MSDLKLIKEIESIVGVPFQQTDQLASASFEYVVNKEGQVNGFSIYDHIIDDLDRLVKILKKLKALTTLSLIRTELTNIGPLKELRQLEILILEDNWIEEISSLLKLTRLIELNIRDNRVEDIYPLKKLTNLTSLDLYNNHVKDLTPLRSLHKINYLNIDTNWFRDISPLEKLTNLTELWISNNYADNPDPGALRNLTKLNKLWVSTCDENYLAILKDLPDLRELGIMGEPGTSLKALKNITSLWTEPAGENIAFVEGMTQLTILKMDQGEISSITPLKDLTNLEELDLGTNVITDLRPLKKLHKLRLLDLSHNKISDLSPLKKLTALHELEISRNQLTDVSALKKLTQLRKLDLSNNQITFIDKDLLKEWGLLEELCLSDNPIRNIPLSIIQGDNCLDNAKNYFKDRAKGMITAYETKLILVGNGRVGKTSLLNRWLDNTYDPGQPSTHAIQLKCRQLSELAHYKQFESIQLNFWDFGGQEIYHTTHRFFMRTQAIFLLIWDARTEQTSEQEEVLPDGKVFRYKNHSLLYWLSYIKTLSENSPVILVQTHRKRDGEQSTGLTASQLKEYNVQYSLAVESSLPAANGFAALQDNIAHLILQKMEQVCTEIPEQWYTIRNELEKLRQQNKKQLAINEFEDICLHAGLDENSIGTVLDYFHNAGAFFYRPMLFQNRIVLDQAWAIEAVYTLFDRKQSFTRLHSNGEFRGKDLEVVWQNYTQEERELFITFMQECEICYEDYRLYGWGKRRFKPSFAERTFVAPQLLPSEKPKDLFVFRDRKGIYFRYRHRFLHAATLQRLIIRIGFLAGIHRMWQKGILLELPDKGIALIETFPESNELVIRLEDNSKWSLLDKIRNELTEIHQDEKDIEEWVSLDGVQFVNLAMLKDHFERKEEIKAENGVWVKTASYQSFLHTDEKKRFVKNNKRKAIPLLRRTIALLQQEINSRCPVCGDLRVELFEIHHIDGNRNNHEISNLLLVCEPCHSEMTHGDKFPPEKVKALKKQLQAALGGNRGTY